MIRSRSLTLMRLCCSAKKQLLQQNNRNSFGQIISRNSHEYQYRKVSNLGELEKSSLFLGTAFWWWMFWHIITSYEDVLGYRYPDPSEWTNEELGIPED